MQSLSAEIERTDPATRTAYEVELRRVMEAVAAGLVNGTEAERRARAWVMLSLLVGGATLARAVPGEETSEQIAEAVQRAVLGLAEGKSGE